MIAEKKQIVILHNSLQGWGVERNLSLFGAYLNQETFDVWYLLTTQKERLSQDGRSSQHEILLNTPQIRQNSYFWFINFSLKLINVLRWLRRNRRKIDFIVCSVLDETLIAFISKKFLRLRAKFIIFNQIRLSESAKGTSWFLKLLVYLFAKVNRTADSIICLSNGIADELKSKYNVQKEIVIHPSCVDLMKNALLSQNPISEQWLLSDDRQTLLFVGRLVNQQKRVDILIRAIKTIVNRRPTTSFKVLIIGDGIDDLYLNEMVQSLELTDTIYFLGYKDNPYPYYAMAECLLFTSDFEGFGNVIIEAMGCGLPIIATNCPSGPAEILENGKWGILVPVGDSEFLAEEILRFLESSDLRRELQEKSTQRVHSFTCDEVFQRLEKYLLEVSI